MYKSVILPLAKKDIQDAAKWYNEQQGGLGKRFITQIRKAVHFIRQNNKATVVRYENVHTALLNKFPYMIHFTVDDHQKLIIIVAVLHTSRNPEVWKGRAR